MSEITIKIRDNEDETISINFEADPPIKPDDVSTNAQYAALRALQAALALEDEDDD